MKIVQIYDNGTLFGEAVLDIKEETLIDQFLSGIKTIAAISLALNYPTIASISHSLVNSYKNVLAVRVFNELIFSSNEADFFGRR